MEMCYFNHKVAEEAQYSMCLFQITQVVSFSFIKVRWKMLGKNVLCAFVKVDASAR